MDETPTQAITRALAALTDPPGDITSVANEEAWHSVVTARDGNVESTGATMRCLAGR